jgi:hypothetical protein
MAFSEYRKISAFLQEAADRLDDIGAKINFFEKSALTNKLNIW